MGSSRARRTALVVAALLVVGAFASIYTSYRRDIDRAYERIEAGSHIAQTRCGPIEYTTPGDGPPLLSVHGAGGGFDQGLELAEPLARAGFRVIAMSRFGYLRTPLPAHASAAAQADAHACLLDALTVKRVAVLGTSAGGALVAAVRAAPSGAHRRAGAAHAGGVRAAAEQGTVDAHAAGHAIPVQHGVALGFPLLGDGQARARNVRPRDPRHAA